MGVPGQALRGLVAQGMSGRKAATAAAYAAVFPAGSWTFTAPEAGAYKFVAWGGGANFDAAQPGGSGAYIEKTIRLARGQTVALVVGRNEENTTVTDQYGNVATAGGTTTAAGGTASGGDVNLNGSAMGVAGLGTGGGASSGTDPGGGAPANLPFRGGAGGNAANTIGVTPGGGGGSASGGQGGFGLVIVLLVQF